MNARTIAWKTAVKLGTVLCLCSTVHAGGNDSYRVSSAQLVIQCPLTVGGSFEARSKVLDGVVAPAPAPGGVLDGILSVDLRRLETGIAMRDRHMRTNYLEVEKGPEFATATLTRIAVDRLDGKSGFRGMLTLHGQQREVTGTADVSAHDGGYRVQAQFPLRVSDFAIPSPTYLGVGVKDGIEVKVSFVVQPVAIGTR